MAFDHRFNLCIIVLSTTVFFLIDGGDSVMFCALIGSAIGTYGYDATRPYYKGR